MLLQKGSQHQLTETGRVLAQKIRDARPPIWYWYKEFYLEAPNSPAFARYCERLYGKSLCQEGFSDLAQIDALLYLAKLGEQNKVLDLGCGNGMITEYISDVTSACVTGMDYIPEAIAQAQLRTASKRERLSFTVGNLDNLPFPPRSFDTLISIDSLYMPNDLDSTLAQMQKILIPAGQMLIFYSQMVGDAQTSRDILLGERTPLGQALQKAGLAYHTWDFSAETYVLLQRKRQVAEAMWADFETEGRSFLYDHLVAESESNPASYDPHTSTMSRYLYLVKT
jgi:ubiquinone/menaquinone biosynthesis C-methylase UbiE